MIFDPSETLPGSSASSTTFRPLRHFFLLLFAGGRRSLISWTWMASVPASQMTRGIVVSSFVSNAAALSLSIMIPSALGIAAAGGAVFRWALPTNWLDSQFNFYSWFAMNLLSESFNFIYGVDHCCVGVTSSLMHFPCLFQPSSCLSRITLVCGNFCSIYLFHHSENAEKFRK